MFNTLTNKTRLVQAIVLVFASMALLGCHTAEQEAKKQALVEAVKRYNSQLRLAYLENNLNYMDAVSTEDHMSSLFPVFAALRLEDSYMRAEQLTFEVEGARLVKKDKGWVDTKEKWVFWWQSHKTNEITKPKNEVFYHMRYNLVLQGGVWKVDKLEDLDPNQGPAPQGTAGTGLPEEKPTGKSK